MLQKSTTSTASPEAPTSSWCALAALLAACAAPPVHHEGPVTGVAVAGGRTFTCSQAGLFAGDRFLAPLPFRPFALAAHDGAAPFLLAGGGAPARRGELALLDLQGRVLAQTTLAQDLVYAVAIAPDGSEATAALADGRVLRVALPGLAVLGERQRHDGPAVAVAYAPDGCLLASAGRDGRILVADPRTTTHAAAIVDHTAPVTCVAFSPDSQLLASGAADARIRLHERTGRLLHTWQRLGGPIERVAFDGAAIVYTTRAGAERPAAAGTVTLPAR